MINVLNRPLYQDLVPIRRALISVFDKEGLNTLCQALQDSGADILSTGGTAKAIAAAGFAVTEVSAYTGFPEILDGRVKTLHPKIHAGLLARRDDAVHQRTLTEEGIAPIDLVVVNLYPFQHTRKSSADPSVILEHIDIGGPAMIRAAAKNHEFVTVLTDPADYAEVIAALADKKAAPYSLRRRLAKKAFAHTAVYDAEIANWLDEDAIAGADAECALPALLSIKASRIESLRYGENPHQNAALYKWNPEGEAGLVSAKFIQGKALSYNNLIDADTAFEAVNDFQSPAVVIVKHANPCGMAIAATLFEAYRKALAGDPLSAFGGVIGLNRPLDGETAEEIRKTFFELIVAPVILPEAREALAVKPNLRLLETGGLINPFNRRLQIKSITGGFLVQERDYARISERNIKIVTSRVPSAAEMADLLFAFQAVKYVKSNAILYAKDGATVGIGAGQMSRVDAARLAGWKAEQAGVNRAAGSVAASDAFFPFADGLEAVIAAGVRAVIQPGGSIRDPEVIAAADAANIAMVFTGQRHFRH